MNFSELLLIETKKIIDNSTCWESLENEVLKLYVLFATCVTLKDEKGDDVISRNYIVEKVARLLQRSPIVLHEEGKKRYASMLINMRLQQKEEEGECSTQ
jgi:hypothetical protein